MKDAEGSPFTNVVRAPVATSIDEIFAFWPKKATAVEDAGLPGMAGFGDDHRAVRGERNTVRAVQIFRDDRP